MTSIPLEELKATTNNFADEYLVAKNSIVKVYKVQEVLIRRSTSGRPNLEMRTDIGVNNQCKHKNIVPLLGYCVREDEEHEAIMVIKNEVNGRLDKHLSDPTLTWMQRLRICVGVARAISYLHYDFVDPYHYFHCNIKSSKILLDDNWEPKLFGFEFATTCHQNQQLSLARTYSGTVQYMDPAFETTGGLSYKSDVFSFGVVLFEVLFGRKASIVNGDKWYFAKLARRRYEERRLDDMIDPILRQQMGTQSLDIFTETSYCCLNEQRAQRLNIKQVVTRLEEALEHQLKHESPELLTIADQGTTFIHPKGKNMDHLKIRLSDIKLATKNFADTYLIGSGGFAMVYRAELDHFDSSHSLSDAEKEKGEFPKKRSMVAIKRILDTKGKQGFFGEIEMLSSCKHQNIVSLLGFCDEDSHMILVYELVSNGSLDDYLETNNMISFTWARRIRLCLDIARGLNYLHTNTDEKPMIVHRDIKSANILLDNNLEAKIADFGLSKLRPESQKSSTLKTIHIAGTEVYLDPEYMKTGKLKKESDVYSFGVVLLEIMCGRVAYDKIYFVDNGKGLPFIARRFFSEGRMKEMVDPRIREAYENIFMINKGISQDSLDTFTKLAYQCLAETQAERPSMEVAMNELQKALSFEENHKDNLQISVEVINLATQNFSDKNCVGSGRYWKAYKGEVLHANADGRYTSIVAKRWNSKSDHQFLTELRVLFKFKHENIIGLAGYCNDVDEKVTVYEHASNGTLDKHLNNASLTWTRRLKICIDVARGLDCLHGEGDLSECIVHRGIKSANIQLDGAWKAKISNMHLSTPLSNYAKDIEHISDDANNSLGYLDPAHISGYRQEMDIYSLGVVLFEILCGRLAWAEGCADHSQSLGPLAKCLYEEGKLDEMVFEGIKEQIVSKSLTAFQKVACACLNDVVTRRPSARGVMVQLEEALEFQEDYEIWEAKLPKDYKDIFHMSKIPQICSTESNKNLYDMLNKGILLQEDKVWFSIGSNGERNETISARKFSYKKRWLHRWRSVPESRFPKVAEVLDVRNLMIEIKLRTPLLSLGVNYKVNLIFRFCGTRKSSAKRMYVNLKYKKGGENFHAYFATWRDDGWMIIELCPFFYNKEDTDFEVLLESFSRCYSGSRTIYVEGIEFQAINNVNQVEIGKSKEVQQVLGPNSKWDKLKSLLSEKNRKIHDMLSDVNTKKDHMVSAKEFLYNTSDVKLLQLKRSVQSRFQEVVELPSQQVMRIKCKIKLQMLSPRTEYACYLVYKLSERCRGLHCPVIVRDLLHWEKGAEILYFRSPSPWNLHDTNRVPEKREDGWMEVNVWKFNSDFELRYGSIPMNLKLVTYEGNMSGLIVCGLEIRPI